ncbi:MAG TPA: DUF3048 domain-containing protein [Actinomycetota bacterium]
MSGSHRTPTRGRFALSRRAKIVAAGTTAALVGAAFGYFAFFPEQAPAFVRSAVRGAMESVGIADDPPPVCPLTGEERTEEVPARPALGIKVENAPESRPQAALNEADVVLEEPVEGGYTRFIAIFQCGESDRVGPVRSGRATDPDYLRQLGPAVFGYSGAVAAVGREVPKAGLVGVNFDHQPEAFTRDPNRSAPHDIFTSTAALWDVGADAAEADDREPADAPEPVFAFSETWEGRSRRLPQIGLPYSSVSDVVWRWARRQGAWLRSHGDVPHTLEDGTQVSATNVVIQVVEVTDSAIVDAAGNASPDVELTGSGRAYVLRDGRMIPGRWERENLDEVTRFVTRDGEEITLAPGRTWVELLPSPIEIVFPEPVA